MPTMSEETEFLEITCPNCKHPVLVEMTPEPDEQPRIGDYILCQECCSFSVFETTTTLRNLSNEELDYIYADPKVGLIQSNLILTRTLEHVMNMEVLNGDNKPVWEQPSDSDGSPTGSTQDESGGLPPQRSAGSSSHHPAE